MKPLLALTLPGMLLLAAAACSAPQERPAPVPRPRAYPRPALYPPAYRPEPLGALTLAINDSAIITRPRPDWLDITYPAYGITVNATLTPATPATIPAILANRRERMARDLDGAAGTIEQRPGMTLATSPAALHTPLHLLLTDSATYVLSAVAVTGWPPAAPLDSITPYVDALAADLRHLLPSEF